jgi:large subunit ribosomal protein L17
MRHRVHGFKLGRKTNHRRAMWRNMAVSLFTHGQITTTLPKAKSVKPFVEKLISAAKQGDLASRRRVIKMIGDRIMIKGENDDAVQRNKYGEVTGGPKVVKTLFDEIAPRYADRTGGYTRIIKLAKHRIGDGSSLCVLQLVGSDDENGPQVSGQYSRRRDKANKRMERAAALRKDGAATATAVAEPQADTAPEAPVEEPSADEATDQAQPQDQAGEEKPQ